MHISVNDNRRKKIEIEKMPTVITSILILVMHIEMVNLIVILMKMGDPRYTTFDYGVPKQYGISEKMNKN